MAFHVACPITCRRICYCELGFPERLKSGRARSDFLEEIARVEEFLNDPWLLRPAGGDGNAAVTVQVAVPRIVPPPAAPQSAAAGVEDDGGEEAAAAAAAASSAQARRSALQRQAAAASQAAEDYVRRLESGMALDVPGEAASDLAREDQGSSTIKVICRICFSGENEGSERAIKMLSCKICNKKYHRSCLKIWAEYRDLFHWSSWACPSCRICEVCRRAGDPTKLMYCKRCDDAYHCYCQQPPHKNVSHGPYLCPKHTRCHSCGSTVPGSGLSTRWFLGYTCCDACGRLFVKGKYCPVCLKVYRDSEVTPMVCCDVCQQWVHCVCDGISDEKYQQFQTDRNLYYKCAACRGDCYQVKDINDAVRELWKRRDKADRDLIASLRSAAGLPSEEEIFSISPYSDDDESGPIILKNDYGRSLKFSVKGLADKTTKSSKEYGKNFLQNSSLNNKYAKKGYRVQSGGKPEELYRKIGKQHESRSLDSNFKDQKNAQTKSWRTDVQGILSSPNSRSPGSDREKPLVDQQDTSSIIKEAVVNNVNKPSKVHIRGSKTQGLHFKEGAAKNVGKNETAKGTKLVIHIGAKNRNTTSSPRSEASSCHREQDIAAANGSGDTSQRKEDDFENYELEAHAGIDRIVVGGLKHEERENSVVKLRKVSDMHRKSRADIAEESELAIAHRSPLIIRKRRSENEEVLPGKQSVSPPIKLRSQNHLASEPFASKSSDDPKPLLKLKFKNPYFEQRSSWAPQGVEEKNAVKGQRSKRKRPSMEKLVVTQEDESYTQLHQEKSIEEVMDANWILQKLGKDAIGKRVEVHQASDNSWRKGVVSDVIEGSASLSVHLDDGRSKTLELGKQGIRFIAQKQKRKKASIDSY